MSGLFKIIERLALTPADEYYKPGDHMAGKVNDAWIEARNVVDEQAAGLNDAQLLLTRVLQSGGAITPSLGDEIAHLLVKQGVIETIEVSEVTA